MLFCAVIALGFAVTHDIPHPLPGVAFGSPIVLIALRATVLFAVLIGVLIVIVRAWEGDLPSELGPRGVRWETSRSLTVIAREVKLSLIHI